MQITWYGLPPLARLRGNSVPIDPFFTGDPAFGSDKGAAIEGVLGSCSPSASRPCRRPSRSPGERGDGDDQPRHGCRCVQGLEKFTPMKPAAPRHRRLHSDHGVGGPSSATWSTVRIYVATLAGSIVRRKVSRWSTIWRHRHFLRHGPIAEMISRRWRCCRFGDGFTMSPSTAALAVTFFKLDSDPLPLPLVSHHRGQCRQSRR